jgi:hypothetical protein
MIWVNIPTRHRGQRSTPKPMIRRVNTSITTMTQWLRRSIDSQQNRSPQAVLHMPDKAPQPGRAIGSCLGSIRRLRLAATIHAHAALARSSSAATGRRTSRCTKPWNRKIKQSLQHPQLFRPFQFFDQTGVEETSASFEARSAPRSYPTPIN